MIDSWNYDDGYKAGQADERAAVVAWLRKRGHEALADSISASGDDGHALWAYGDARIRAADAIERGDHTQASTPAEVEEGREL